MRPVLAALVLTCAALPLAGAAEARIKVATTFTVIADMASHVAGGHADVVSITKPGAEIHGYEPTPQDLVRTMDADLVLNNGLNLELWFQQFLAQLGEVPAVTVSDGIVPIPIGEGGHQGQPNPHAWMGLDNAMIYVDNIAAALAAADPENAGAYAANATSYKQQLHDTIQPLRDRIAAIPEAHRWLVTCEGAFSYLARDLGLHEAYLWPINADQTGTPRQVKAVIDTVRAHGVPAVFCESTVSDRPARRVAAETGARFGGVLYVDSLSGPDGPVPSYEDLLRVTVETIADGLEGAP